MSSDVDIFCRHTGEVLDQYDLFPVGLARVIRSFNNAYKVPAWYDGKGMLTGGSMLSVLGDIIKQGDRCEVSFVAGNALVCHGNVRLARRWLRDEFGVSYNDNVESLRWYEYETGCLGECKYWPHDDRGACLHVAGRHCEELGKYMAYHEGEFASVQLERYVRQADVHVGEVLRRCVGHGCGSLLDDAWYGDGSPCDLQFGESINQLNV